MLKSLYCYILNIKNIHTCVTINPYAYEYEWIYIYSRIHSKRQDGRKRGGRERNVFREKTPSFILNSILSHIICCLQHNQQRRNKSSFQLILENLHSSKDPACPCRMPAHKRKKWGVPRTGVWLDKLTGELWVPVREPCYPLSK